jgi:indole-3-glycerol phosphate synthase
VLVILRMLEDAELGPLVDAAHECEMFVLLEAFDAGDLARARAFMPRGVLSRPPTLVGLNARDLATLAVDTHRFESLRDEFPPRALRVAESGVEDATATAHVARLGYDLALVGTALMRAADPQGLVAAMLAAGRAAHACAKSERS